MTDYHEFFHQFFQVTRQLSKKMNEQLADLDLYSAQWTVIYLLKNNGPSTQAELCHYLNVEAPTMTRTITRLEEAGWVLKTNGRNKREKMIQLSDKAIEMYPLWKEAIQKFEAQVMDAIPEDSQKIIQITFQQMMTNLKEEE
ncbi:MarR family winged helix-turn-helix transcriptional regulator [Lederbergia citrea]|uniref:MarR family transcriptional regulator n=1 Tax=Lederbergia citrea TaxID=2833581 RepID=A0A942UXL8_9BACI|nr:MarR family transcriptional regulator [Lederbergia citrea]MBS4179224.1 MarR family transcriptional regulator [Lederbergia citrea]MBS4205887.1 MarR family transcriptional regulator [Lederbergia citrea]MBS4224664.1 MarR family transcriptional regulator [Lederbergia citrea]